MAVMSEPLAGVSRWPRTIRSLGHRNFRLFWSGQIFSIIGTWMAIVAQGWVVFSLTDSPFMLGLVNFIALVPVLPISLLSGVISDRLPRRNLIIATELVLSLQALVMAVLIWSGLIQVWHIVILSLILGIAAAFEQPARLSFIMDVVGKEDLSNAVALNSSAYNIARIIGPAIAGLLIVSVGAAICFLINSLTYLVVILALLVIKVFPRVSARDSLEIVGGITDGFRYIMGSLTIRGLLLIVAVSSFMTLPYIALMPAFASDTLQSGPEGLGFLLTAVGIGAIIGALIVANLRSGRRGNWLIVANIAGPLFLLLFSQSSALSISLILVLFVGSSNAIRQTLANSLLQLNSLESYHGRVMSIFNLLFNGMSRFGALVIGAVAEFTDVSVALGVGASMSAIIGIILLIKMPYVRRLP